MHAAIRGTLSSQATRLGPAAPCSDRRVADNPNRRGRIAAQAAQTSPLGMSEGPGRGRRPMCGVSNEGFSQTARSLDTHCSRRPLIVPGSRTRRGGSGSGLWSAASSECAGHSGTLLRPWATTALPKLRLNAPVPNLNGVVWPQLLNRHRVPGWRATVATSRSWRGKRAWCALPGVSTLRKIL